METVSKLIDLSFQDHEIPCDEMSVFYNSPVLTTSGYLARAVVNNVLKESETLINFDKSKRIDRVLTFDFTAGIHIPQDYMRLQLPRPVREGRNASTYQLIFISVRNTIKWLSAGFSREGAFEHNLSSPMQLPFTRSSNPGLQIRLISRHSLLS